MSISYIEAGAVAMAVAALAVGWWHVCAVVRWGWCGCGCGWGGWGWRGRWGEQLGGVDRARCQVEAVVAVASPAAGGARRVAPLPRPLAVDVHGDSAAAAVESQREVVPLGELLRRERRCQVSERRTQISADRTVSPKARFLISIVDFY